MGHDLGSEHPGVATNLNKLAGLYQVQGRYGEAEPLHKRALAVWEKALGPNRPNVATTLENSAVLLRETGRTGIVLRAGGVVRMLRPERLLPDRQIA